MSVSWRWRILAVLSLVLLGALVVLAVLFTLHNVLLLLAVALTTALVLYASWLVFGGSGRRYFGGWLLLIVSGLLLIAEATRLFTREHNLKLLSAMALVGVVYVLLVARLRTVYWQQRRQAARPHGTAPAHHHPVLIVNPKSGDGRAIKADIPQKARSMGIDVRVLAKGDDISAMAKRAVGEGADVLGISGGDGSLGVVAAVAMQHDIPMVVLPGGTRCHFARDLGMDPKRIVDALESFNGVERRVDVGDINGRIFLNNASFGLYGEIIDHPEYREHKIDATRAVLRRIMEQHSLYDLQFVDTHGNFYQQVVSLLVGVNKYEMVHLLELGYRKQLDGGVLQASAITELNDQWMRRLLAQTPMSLAKFSKGMEGFAQWETGTLRVNSSSEMLVVGVDGEREEYVAPVDISIKPGALRLLVPAEGNRPRRMRAFDTEVVRALRQEATGKS